jgi:hypothetical protein
LTQKMSLYFSSDSLIKSPTVSMVG